MALRPCWENVMVTHRIDTPEPWGSVEGGLAVSHAGWLAEAFLSANQLAFWSHQPGHLE